MATTVTLSSELHAALQKLAEAEQLSIDELVESLLSEYVDEQTILSETHPDQEEINAVRQTYEAAYKPGAKWYNLEEVEAHINTLI